MLMRRTLELWREEESALMRKLFPLVAILYLAGMGFAIWFAVKIRRVPLRFGNFIQEAVFGIGVPIAAFLLFTYLGFKDKEEEKRRREEDLQRLRDLFGPKALLTSYKRENLGLATCIGFTAAGREGEVLFLDDGGVWLQQPEEGSTRQ